VDGEVRKQSVEVLGRKTGSRGIVDQHPIVTICTRSERCEAVAHRLTSFLATSGYEDAGWRDGLPVGVFFGQGHHGTGAPRIGQEGSQGPFNNGAAAERGILLRAISTEAASYARGRHYQPVSHWINITMRPDYQGHDAVLARASSTRRRLLGVSIEELFGKLARSGQRGPTPQLQQKIERLSALPESQQKMPLQMLDGMLSEAGH
jgi:hypothetical protein